jgi:hypothetical protein
MASRKPAGKLDLYKEHAEEYAAPKIPALITIAPARYLSVAGKGAPGGSNFNAALSALYGAAFTIKMASKLAGRDYKVCGLEGLWWTDREGTNFLAASPDEWRWKLLIRTPDFITKRDLARALATLEAKRKAGPLAGVTLDKIAEGRCVQVLHVGPYNKETETISRMMSFARQRSLAFHGLHHEIYLSDPRRVAPERLRTILRHPVRNAA